MEKEIRKKKKKSIDIFFFFNDTATTEIYTLSLHDALPIYKLGRWFRDFLDISNQVESWGGFEAIVHAANFTYENMLYNHIYYYEGDSGSKQVAGVKEYKMDNGAYKYAVFTRYIGFNADICDNESVPGQYITPNTADLITCRKVGVGNNKDNIIIQEYSPDDIKGVYWPDMTSRIRPR